MQPDVLAGLVTGGSNVLDVGINAALQAGQNKQSRRYATYMYDRQRTDALADWQRQIDYMAPSAQMQRYKDAGLNPMLIYGNMANAPSVRASSPGNPRMDAPQVNFGGAVRGGLMEMYDVKMKDVNIDLARERINQMKKANLLLDVKTQGATLDNLMKGKVNEKTAVQIDILKQNLGVLSAYGMEMGAARLRNLEADTFMKIEENARRELLTDASIKEKAQRIALMAAQVQAIHENTPLTAERVNEIKKRIEMMDKEGKLKDWEIKLSETGGTKSDPWYIRTGRTILQEFVDDLLQGWGKPE